jgi:agmatinase
MKQPFDPGAAAAPDSGIFGLSVGSEEAAVHVLGVPFDATASYRKGACRGPAAILRASRQVDLFDLVTGDPWKAGIWMAPPDPDLAAWNEEASRLADGVIAAGGNVTGNERLKRDLARVDALGSKVNERVCARVDEILAAGRLPALVGGDHSTTFGAIVASAAHFARPDEGLGVLHFDAHADLRRAYEGFEWSHASILDNVLRKIDGVSQVVQVGVRDVSPDEVATIRGSEGRVRTLFDHEWASARLDGRDLRALIRKHLAHLPKHVFVTFDVDGLDPALCPSTGTPVPGGLGWHEAMLWLEELARSGSRVVGLDVNEVNPGAAGPDEDSWDAIVGARLLYRLIGFALATRT